MCYLPNSRLVATTIPIGVLPLVAALLFTASLDSLIADGAPVTFRFEAEITSIDRSSDATFDLPANTAIGDILSGLLQFEPFGFGQSGEASSLKVNLGTEVFSVAGAPLATQNNLILALHPVGVAIVDSIGVGCSGSCTVVFSSSSNDLEIVRLGLGLVGSFEQENGGVPGEGLISQGESLGDADLWNRLLVRQLRMEFTSNSGPGSIQLEAVFGPMVAIPEPSGFLLMMLGVVSLTRHSLRRK